MYVYTYIYIYIYTCLYINPLRSLGSLLGSALTSIRTSAVKT